MGTTVSVWFHSCIKIVALIESITSCENTGGRCRSLRKFYRHASLTGNEKLIETPNKWVQQLLIIEESLRPGVGGTPAKVWASHTSSVASDHCCDHVIRVLHVSVRAVHSIFQYNGHKYANCPPNGT